MAGLAQHPMKELVPVIIATVLHDRQWKGRAVQFRVNTSAMVDILNATYSKESHLMHFIRYIQ